MHRTSVARLGPGQRIQRGIVLGLLWGFGGYASVSGQTENPVPDRLHHRTFTLAAGPDLMLHRSTLELGFATGTASGGTGFFTSMRLGSYSPRGTFGTLRAEGLGYQEDRRPYYAGIQFGLIDRRELSGEWRFITRTSVSLTTLWGQPAQFDNTQADPEITPRVGPHLAPGVEVGLGLGRWRSGFSPWAELRVNAEYVRSIGVIAGGPTLLVGLSYQPKGRGATSQLSKR